ncbi:MAG: biopolymer transporter ExbB [Lautropia sp. SCN 66-9]|nr:MAG: biopolymer transporter ExbB [Lautropia sp. SCN 66-9]
MANNMGFDPFASSADAIAWFVLALLVFMSVGSWFLIVTKGIRALSTRRRSAEFLKDFWEAASLEAVAKRLRSSGVTDPFSHMVHHGFTAIEQHSNTQKAARLVDAGTSEDFMTRALKRAIAQDMARLERGQSFLATVASTAPFVGLFGTVWGIYHALMAIGMAGDAGLDKVAGPVGEALIMTGIGLAVAIPAAVAYNAFARLNRNVRTELESFAYDLFALFGTGTKLSPMLADVRATSDLVLRRVQDAVKITQEGEK